VKPNNRESNGTICESGTLFADRPLRQIPDDRQFVILVVADLDHHEDPCREDGQLQQVRSQPLEGHAESVRDEENRLDDPLDYQPGDKNVETLEGMEADIRVVPVTFTGQHHYSGDPAHPGNVAEQGGAAVADSGERISHRSSGARGHLLARAALDAKLIGVANLIPALNTESHCWKVIRYCNTEGSSRMLGSCKMRALIFLLLLTTAARAAKLLEIYFIDTEGGQATLVVSPSGQAMLIDTGYTGFGGRDATRIAEAAKNAHAKRINVLFLTHHHADHAGGVKNLLEVMPVESFYDHGPDVEHDNKYSDEYTKAMGSSPHTVYKPGDKIPIKDLDITVVVASHNHIETKGEPNPFCAGLAPKDGEKGENPQSGGVVVQYGKFRFADLGDIEWNEELALMCPENHVGKVDLLLTPHHGTDVPPKADYALAPRVVVMNNGAHKGGKAEAYQTWSAMKGLEDLWQLHFAMAGGKDGNTADTFIANIDEKCEGKYLKVTAREDGSFTVYNSRNKYTKTYGVK